MSVYKRPRRIVTPVARRFLSITLVSLLAVAAATTSVFAADPSSKSGAPGGDACPPAAPASPDCPATGSSGSGFSSSPVLPPGGGYTGAFVPTFGPSTTTASVPDAAPSSASNPSDYYPQPLYPNFAGAACPPGGSVGGTLGRNKMATIFVQSLFPACPMLPGFFDTPSIPGNYSASAAACYAAFNQLVLNLAIPANATITITNSFGDTCVFANGLLASLIPLIPVNPNPPALPGVQTCISAFSQAVLSAQASTVGYWFIFDGVGDTCLFLNGVIVGVHTPADTTLAPQANINACLAAFQANILGGSAVFTGYYIIPDLSGDTCVFLNAALQLVQLPASFTLSPAF